ncbi:dioxygenase [Azorhizobium doebereinerae]|uniref:dioxygenase family protein n=1 Tax=Azorhizobium doebereinerae TaxID=281091 RepID=UPI000687624E|nr:dioxygenase [Azorhizobium doebereinerae]
MAGAPSPRMREVMEALVRHLHAFAREVKLTEAEYDLGIATLNRIGQATHDSHNEGILFADILGFSTLCCLLNNGNAGATETAAALLGPFWRMHSPRTENGGSILRSPTPGPALFVNCRVLDPTGAPIEGVEMDIWHASPVGYYENQDPQQADMNLRGKFLTDAQGRFSFRSVKPAGYPVPTDGPAGDVLRAQNRHPYRPAHVHFLGYREGFKTLVTQVFVDDDERLDSDAVFGVTEHLVGDYRLHESGTPPAPDVTAPWYTLDYTFVMEPGEAKLPTPPIK